MDLNTLIARAQSGDVDARDEIVRRYQGLVKSVVAAFRLSSEEAFEDCCQECQISLLHAVSKFDLGAPAGAAGFASYLRHTFETTCKKFLLRNRLVRITQPAKQSSAVYLAARARLKEQFGRMPTDKEVGAHLGWSELKIRNAKHIESINDIAELNKKVGEGDTEIGYLVPDNRQPTEGDRVMSIMSKDVNTTLGEILTKKQRVVINHRHGLAGHFKMTYKDAAEHLGVAQRTVILHEEAAMKKIKKHYLGEE